MSEIPAPIFWFVVAVIAVGAAIAILALVRQAREAQRLSEQKRREAQDRGLL